MSVSRVPCAELQFLIGCGLLRVTGSSWIPLEQYHDSSILVCLGFPFLIG